MMGQESPAALAAPAALAELESRLAAAQPPLAGSAVRPVKMPLVDRIASGVVTGAPPILVLIGMWFGWSSGLLVWQDILVLAVFYVLIGSGVTVGFHRLLTHRSF